MKNIVKARYSDGAKTLLVTCPYCKHTTHNICKQFNTKQWLGSYVCDCEEELIIEEIK
jgi:hypothetical protein